MKTLTVRQPWASLIVHGIKDIENRTWKTNYRGRVLIHSSAKIIDSKDLFSIEKYNEIPYTLIDDIENNSLPVSAIIGSVEIINCVINSKSIWAIQNQYHWVLANPVLFKKPISNVKGKLSLWESECEILICPECGAYTLHDNHDIGVPNWGNPICECEKCGNMILESEFEYLK